MVHPEQTEDEIYLTNSNPGRDLNDIGWITKRVVRPAYDVNGREVRDLVAVLVAKKELEEAGLSLQNLHERGDIFHVAYDWQSGTKREV